MRLETKAGRWNSEIVAHFDEYAATYAGGSDRNSIFGYFFRRRQELVLAVLDRMSGGTVLDVGCGPGIYAGHCVQRGFSYVGLDISSKMIEECRARSRDMPDACSVVGRIQDLSFADHSFDSILCLGALEYVPEHEEASALTELARVLKPGGVLVFSCANKLSPYRLWGRVYSRLMWIVKRRIEVPIRDFEQHRLRGTLETFRLAVGDVRYFAINLFPSPLEVKYPRQAAWMASRLERHADGWFGASWDGLHGCRQTSPRQARGIAVHKPGGGTMKARLKIDRAQQGKGGYA